MPKQAGRWIGVGAAVLALAAVAFAGQAGAKPPAAAAERAIYTYVATWAVPRADWVAAEKYYQSAVPLMKALTDSGTLEGWGQARAFVHDESGTTHINWLTATSFAGLAKALEEMHSKLPLPAAFMNAKHRDEILRSTMNGGKAGAGGAGMLWLANYELQSGTPDDFADLFETQIKPLFDAQVAAGTVLAYSLEFQAVHTDSPKLATIAYLLPDAAAIDKFQEALAAYETKNPSTGASLEATMNYTAHRDALFEVLAFGEK